MSGFALAEFILVLALFSLVAVGMFPLSVAFYQTQVLTELDGGITSALRLAHAEASSQKYDQPQGVKILNNAYVSFVGQSYLDRDENYDQVINFPDSVVINGIDEIVFTNFTGIPSATGTVTLQYFSENTTVTINDGGVIN